MKIAILGAAVALTLAGALPAAAQNVEFTLINNSSQSIHFFYASPANEDQWGEDLLGDTGTLESGMQATTYIYDGSDQCVYDFRFESAEGGELEARGVDICSLGSYTITD